MTLCGSPHCWLQAGLQQLGLFIALKKEGMGEREKSADCNNVQKTKEGKEYLPARKEMKEKMQRLYLVMKEP